MPEEHDIPEAASTPPASEDFRVATLVYRGVGVILLGLLIFEGVTLGGLSYGWVGAILGPIVIYMGAVALGLVAFFAIIVLASWETRKDQAAAKQTGEADPESTEQDKVRG